MLHEEQEKILNNINLQGIEDPEVIQLYTAVLDEINQIQVADKELALTQIYHGTTMQRKVTWDLLAFGTDLATAQYGSALRNGANSLVGSSEHDLPARQRCAEDRESPDAARSPRSRRPFWTLFGSLARRKNIPDRWLVRGNDLDQLDLAMAETNPEVRRRVLQRMEPNMQAYPPYWYYVARTEQELGELIAASETYQRLAVMGDGHFRQDDMLATSLANLATIQEHLGLADAVVTAGAALDYSTEVWEANLLCARVLQRHQEFAKAEDAILRNLDVEIETTQSRVFLASLYYHTDNKAKLAKFLENEEVVASLPAPVLLRCAASLGVERTPAPVLKTVIASLQAQPRLQLGRDELVVRMSPTWQLHLARVDLLLNGKPLQPVPVERVDGLHQLRYSGQFASGGLLNSQPEKANIAIRFTYPDETVVNVTFQPNRSGNEGGAGSFNLRAISRNRHPIVR